MILIDVIFYSAFALFALFVLMVPLMLVEQAIKWRYIPWDGIRYSLLLFVLLILGFSVFVL